MKKWFAVFAMAYPLMWVGLGATGVTEAYALDYMQIQTGSAVPVKSKIENLVPRDLEPISLEPQVSWERLEVPSGASSFKAQESYKVFRNPQTKQYQLQQSAWTDEDGFRWFGEEGYYMVAVGSYYASGCGEVLRIKLDSGRQFTAIVWDQKDDRHTDARNQYCMQNGSLVEFIVDLNRVSDYSRRRGDMSFSAEMQGRVVKVERMVADA